MQSVSRFVCRHARTACFSVFKSFKRVVAILGVAVLVAAQPASAEELGQPTGDVILTVAGAMTNYNGDGVAVFDLSMLDALPQGEVVTVTPWADGPQTYTGVLGSAFLDAVGATGSLLALTALNDYTVEIPVSDFRDYPVVLSTRINGNEIPVREKGPIFVMYPYDDHAELLDTLHFSRAIWQVKAIEIRD